MTQPHRAAPRAGSPPGTIGCERRARHGWQARRLVVAFLFASVLTPGASSAQVAQERRTSLPPLPDGYTVRIRTGTGTYEGVLAASTANDVRLAIGDSVGTFSASSIDSLWVQHTHARRGAVLGGAAGGLALGALTGLLVSALCESECEGAGDFVLGFVLGGAAGAAGGSVAGIVLGSWTLTWKRAFP